MTYANSRNPSIQGWLKLKPKFLLLLVLLFVHRSCSTVSNIDWSNVKSLTVERRIGNYDLFTLYMRSSHRCAVAWCASLFKASYFSAWNNRSACNCTCGGSRYTFIPSMQSCLNVSELLPTKFGGCQWYFDDQKLLAHPADPIDVTASTQRAFSVKKTATSCILSHDYKVYDYSGFQRRWINASDGFFNSLSMANNAKSFYIKWQPVSVVPPTLNGRIVRLLVTCSKDTSSSSSGCVLLKVKGTVNYHGLKMSSRISATSSFITGASSSYLSLPSLLFSSVQPALTSMPLPETSTLLPSPSVLKTSKVINAGTSSLPAMQSQTTRLSAFTDTEIETTSKTKFSLSDGISTEMVTTENPHLIRSMTVHPTVPLKTTSMVSASSAAVINKPGGRETQTGGNDNGVVIGAAVGSAIVLGAVIVIFIVFWKRRRAESTKRPGKEPNEVKNPVYGTSANEIPLERSKGSQTMPSSVQDNPLYQGVVISNENSNGTAIYSNPEDDYDNCNVYQSLEKEKPGSPVYQSLNASQGKAAHTTSLPKNSPRTSITGASNSKAKLATGTPKSKPGATGNPYQKPIVPSEPVYNVLEGQDGEEDYEALNVDSLYNILEGPDATYESSDMVLENSTAESDPVCNVVEEAGDYQNPPGSGPSTAQEPLYNLLQDSNAGKDPLIQQSSSDLQDEPVYNILEESDSDVGPSKPCPLSGHDNPTYEQTVEFDDPYAAVHRPGPQRESLYEPLRQPSQDLYAPLG